MTFKIVLAFSAFCTVGFSASALWSLAENQVYKHHRGSKWFMDILESHWDDYVYSRLPSWPMKFTRSVTFTISNVFRSLVDGVHSLWERATIGPKENTLPHAMPGPQQTSKILMLHEGDIDGKGRQQNRTTSISSLKITDDGQLAPQFWTGPQSSTSENLGVRLTLRKAKGTNNLIR